jgi:DNA polymerase-3 subunit alpha
MFDEEKEAAPLPDVPEFPLSDLLAMEREITGLYLSGHPMDEYRATVKAAGAVPIGRLIASFDTEADEGSPREFNDGDHLAIAGVVTSVKTKMTRNNTLMAYITLEDDSGAVELLVFERSLKAFGFTPAEGAVLFVRGKASQRDESKPVQVLADDLFDMQHLPKPQSSVRQQGVRQAPPSRLSKKIYVKVSTEVSKEFETVKTLLTRYPGQDNLTVVFADTGKRLGTTCDAYSPFTRELGAVLGADRVVVM